MKLYLVVSGSDWEGSYEVGLFDSEALAEEIAALDSEFSVLEVEVNSLIGHLFPATKHENARKIIDRHKRTSP